MFLKNAYDLKSTEIFQQLIYYYIGNKHKKRMPTNYWFSLSQRHVSWNVIINIAQMRKFALGWMLVWYVNLPICLSNLKSSLWFFSLWRNSMMVNLIVNLTGFRNDLGDLGHMSPNIPVKLYPKKFNWWCCKACPEYEWHHPHLFTLWNMCLVMQWGVYFFYVEFV